MKTKLEQAIEILRTELMAAPKASFPRVARDHIKSVIAAMRDAQAIIDKLPKTADGVVVVPGLPVFHPNEGEMVIDASGVPDEESGGWCYPPNECYSTREAALAAKNNQS
jgi:hypothetical protein